MGWVLLFQVAVRLCDYIAALFARNVYVGSGFESGLGTTYDRWNEVQIAIWIDCINMELNPELVLEKSTRDYHLKWI